MARRVCGIPGKRRLRATARLVPLSLPALPYPTDRGSFAVEVREAVLRQPSAGRRRWLPLVVAWGHELPDQAVLTWRLSNGGSEVAVFPSAEAALATAQLLYPARILWTAPAMQVG